jgi:hypothetical protein
MEKDGEDPGGLVSPLGRKKKRKTAPNKEEQEKTKEQTVEA